MSHKREKGKRRGGFPVRKTRGASNRKTPGPRDTSISESISSPALIPMEGEFVKKNEPGEKSLSEGWDKEEWTSTRK